jgi:hypothetical protein
MFKNFNSLSYKPYKYFDLETSFLSFTEIVVYFKQSQQATIISLNDRKLLIFVTEVWRVFLAVWSEIIPSIKLKLF